MYVRTIQYLNYSGQVSKSIKKNAFYVSDTPVTFKLGQGPQTWYELVDPKQCYKKQSLKKTHLNSVHIKANSKGNFFQIMKQVIYLL